MTESDRRQRFFRPPCVLVVDDEEGIRFALARLLESSGYEVRVAASGREAIAHLETNPGEVALCICDFKMPGLDGIETLKQMKIEDPDLLRVLLTGYATLDAAIEATNQGLDAFLTKPYHVRELRAKLDELLARRARELAVALLGNVPLFRGVPAELLVQICPSLTGLFVRRGQVIEQSGAASNRFLIVQDGEVALEARGPNGRSRTVVYLGPGDHFGEASVAQAERNLLTAVATLDTRLLALARDDFDRLKAKHPEITEAVARTLTRRLHGAASGPERTSLVIACPPLPGSAHPSQALAAALVEAGAGVALLDLTRPAAGGEPGPMAGLLREAGSVPRYSFAAGASEADIAPALAALRKTHPVTVAALDAVETPASARAMGQAHRALTWLPGARAGLICAQISALHGETEEKPWRLNVPLAELEKGGPALRRVARRLLGTTLGVALSAGGANGIAHIGVLQAFERAGLEVDCIAGCSIGAAVGGMLASGHTLSESADFLMQLTVRRSLWPPFGRPVWEVLRSLVAHHARGYTFEDAAVPFICNATDLLSGEEMVFEQGEIAPAICASIAAPGLFPPYALDGHLYSDGALLNGLPADLLHQRGFEIVVAVDVFGKSVWRMRVPSPLRRALAAGLPGLSHKLALPRLVVRALLLASRRLVEERFVAADATIRPELNGMSLDFDPARYAPMLEAGQRAAEPVVRDLIARRALLAERWRQR